MSFWGEIGRRIGYLRTRSTLDDTLRDEIEFHIHCRTEELKAEGVSAADARVQAIREFGSEVRIREDVRSAWKFLWLEDLLTDLRYAFRQLGKSPVFTISVVLVLAIGIGANTAIFSAINGTFLKTVSAAQPENLVRFRWAGQNDMITGRSGYGYSEPGTDSTFSYPAYQEFLKSNQTLSALFAFSPTGNRLNIVADGVAEIANGFQVSGNYFEALGVQPALGRVLAQSDDNASAEPVAVVSFGYWNRRFGGNPNVVGKIVRINNLEVAIVGVLPREFTGVQRVTDEAPDVTVPLALDPYLGGGTRLQNKTYWWLEIMGRLRDQTTREQVTGNLDPVFRQSSSDGWNSHFASLTAAQQAFADNQNRTHVPHLLVDAGSHGVYHASPADIQPMVILGIVVVLMLMIVCANVANLLLSRSAARQREISVRLSLGATRTRLIRQLLTESVLLSFTGGFVGILVAYWGRTLMPGVKPENAAIDWRVFGFVAGLSMVTGLVFGLAPALRSTKSALAGGLREAGRSIRGGRLTLSRVLVVAQVASSLVLLIAAGLFLQTVDNLRGVEVGFNSQNILLFRLYPSLNGYDQNRTAMIYKALTERLSALPGVRAVALTSRAQLKEGTDASRIFVQGHEGEQAGDHIIKLASVSPNFFDVMEMPLLMGRAFSESDDRSAPRVAVINEAAARKYFAGRNPIGERFGYTVETSGLIEVVGVVRDAKYNSLRDAAPPIEYDPIAQYGYRSVVVELRTGSDPGGILGIVREAVRQIDPNLPLMDVSTQTEQIEHLFENERIFALAYTLFGSLALLLACIGLFGLMSYGVARRTNEMGVRMALGAKPLDVVRLIMRESLVLVFSGVAIGLAVSVPASRVVKSLLFGLSAMDTETIAWAVLLMIAVSALAGYLPARRASRTDPITALHHE